MKLLKVFIQRHNEIIFILPQGNNRHVSKMEKLKSLIKGPTKFHTLETSDCLATSISIMEYTGVWMPDNIKNPWTYKLYSFTLVTIFFYLMVLAEFGYIFTVIGDTERIVEAAVLLISHIVQVVKILNIICRKERIKRVIKFIKGPKFIKTDPVKKAMLEEQLHTAAIAGTIICASAFVTAILWSMIPGLKPELTLPLKTAYPFVITKYPIFEIMYAYSVVSLTIFGVNDAAINYIVSGLMLMAGAHLDVLRDELIEIDGTGTTEPVELMTMIFYIGCVFLELLMYCYPGDLIINKSQQVADAAAPSTWQGSLRSRRALLLCMVRSQRALQVNAGGVFNASLPTAAAVVRAAYSYYAVLQQKINENK